MTRLGALVKAAGFSRGVGVVVMIAAAALGCGKQAGQPYQPGPPPDPDLAALEAFLFWGNGFPIGAPSRAGRDGSNRMGQPGANSFDGQTTVVVGTSAAPGLRISSTGVTADYRVHIYTDDELWWDVGARERPIPSGLSDLFGKSWVPADTGVHVLRMVLDATGQVDEIDETNNERRIEILVIPGDLSAGISFVQWRDGYPYEVTSVKAGTPIMVLAMSGARGVYPDHRAVLDACGAILMDHRVTLSGGTIWAGVRTDSLAFTPQTVGPCVFRFVLDPDGEFPMDADRANNTSMRTLTVLP